MRNQFFLWMCCLLAVSFFGCVSKSQFNAVNDDYQHAKQDISDLEQKLENLHLSLQTSENAEKQCRDTLEKQTERGDTLENQLETSQTQYQSISEQNESLHDTNEELHRSINEKQKVIAIQETVIRLFDDSEQTLQKSIEAQVGEQTLEDSSLPAPTKVVLVNKLLFQSGSASLSEEAKSLLEKLTGILQEKEYTQIQVMGHTDDQPFVPKTDHANNWALSAERAAAVAAFLQERVGVPPERLSATGFGPCRPIASNDTPEGRQQNRRIEIVLQSTE